MNKLIFVLLIAFSIQSYAKECPYSADPINWIMRYCAYKLETDDEIAIQDSKCFRDADKEADEDSKKQDSCEIKKKYKMKFCTESFKRNKYKNAPDCLKDPSVEPFFAGG